MFPHPRDHAQNGWFDDRGNEIRALAGALARLLHTENMDGEGYGALPRTNRRTPDPRQWVPYYYGNQRGGRTWPSRPPRARPEEWRPRFKPRRGSPVAAIKVPRRYQRDQRETRQPRGSNPGGTRRGGPERTANDPRRTPQGGLCGGPERSAKEPQTPSQARHAKTNGGKAKEENVTNKRPTIVTVDEGGQERRWGPLTRTNAWRVGRFWNGGKWRRR